MVAQDDGIHFPAATHKAQEKATTQPTRQPKQRQNGRPPPPSGVVEKIFTIHGSRHRPLAGWLTGEGICLPSGRQKLTSHFSAPVLSILKVIHFPSFWGGHFTGKFSSRFSLFTQEKKSLTFWLRGVHKRTQPNDSTSHSEIRATYDDGRAASLFPSWSWPGCLWCGGARARRMRSCTFRYAPDIPGDKREQESERRGGKSTPHFPSTRSRMRARPGVVKDGP